MNYRKAGKWMLLNFIYTKDSEPFFSSHADLGCSTRNALKLKICTQKRMKRAFSLICEQSNALDMLVSLNTGTDRILQSSVPSLFFGCTNQTKAEGNTSQATEAFFPAIHEIYNSTKLLESARRERFGSCSVTVYES